MVPWNDEDLLRVAGRTDADVVVVDLAELVVDPSVSPDRVELGEAVRVAAASGAEVFVQIRTERIADDLAVAVQSPIAGVVLRPETVAHVRLTDDVLDSLEAGAGFEAGGFEIVAALESTVANRDAFDLVTASPRIRALTLGRADLVMDLRPEPSGEIHLMPFLTERLVAIAAAAGRVALGAWWRAPARGLLADPTATEQAARRGRAVGFRGSLCIDEHQVDALNRGFSPSAQEIDAARAVVDASETTALHAATARRRRAQALLALSDSIDARTR